ncbi:agmatine deiminase family protein [Actinocorallia sp. A-T 12471]|uniref:agmatine deiminase family protein n=1 Tax=Actinocorallia sp. A-T 12471 TaxID=3089813 RepID=UPI0029D067F1|nr:agmatine deiminase family protein [Actinocorallia sp. A-T 12471]MDX6740870.1 agmatine deiminase family protein [Actinocorallia sp. A-T 12471]
MPAEWTPHARTWMAFPTANTTFATGPELEAARLAWARVANTIVRYEPVTVLVHPGDPLDALDGRVETVEVPLDDAWLRDTGPTFTRADDGTAVAVDWVFNGWGAQSWAAWEKDARLAGHVAGLAGVPVVSSPLTQEGGGFHVDGAGTVLLTDTVQLDPDRNPGWSRAQVEAEVHARLGTSKAIWLPRGLTADYGEFGTRGHVDIVAAFTAPGRVVVHAQPDPGHPDHEVSRETAEILRQATDARGERLDVVELRAPTVTEADGELVDYSYVNHYVANGVVVLCAFDDPRDAEAAAVLKRAYPGRDVVLVDARDIFRFGGGVHCVTQQQPL